MAKAKLTAAGAAAAIMLALQPSPAPAAIGPDAAACAPRSRQTALLVTVRGFRERSGSLRVALYGADPVAFLARGGALKRIDLPVSASGNMQVCVALPGAGRYAVAVRHDENGNGQSDMDDGAGFSRNPVLSFASPRPSLDAVAIDVLRGRRPIEIVLNYRTGLTIAPVGGGR